MKSVFILYETNGAKGTIVGVFTSKKIAEEAQKESHAKGHFIQEMMLNQILLFDEQNI